VKAELRTLVPDWSAPPGVRAVFTLRMGGVSAPPYDSLNLGALTGDVPEAVTENRRRLRETLALPAEPVWLQQVHGTTVARLDRREPFNAEPQADASVASRGGAVCAIRVADCMPVLFAATDGSAVAAAHSGWRGLSAGVLEATVRELSVHPSELIAWMGPAIGASNFEVGEDVRAAFMASAPDCHAVTSAFVPNKRGRWQCDLYALARLKLEALGVGSVHGGGWCTYEDASRFFSFRRDGPCGRMAALIWSEPVKIARSV
jgi:YfiH family protein